MMKKLLLCVLVLAVGLGVRAETSVWKVESDSSVLYLGGTFHLLRASDFPLPAEFDAAYADSDSLIFETDLGRLQDPSVQQLMMSKGSLDGETLADVLSPEVYEKLSTSCVKVGVPIEALKGFKPSLVIMTIAMMELQKLGISQEGVDMLFYSKGKQDGKEIGQLETVEEQIDFICSMGEGNEDEFVSHSIRDMDNTKEIILPMLAAWKSGNRSEMEKTITGEMKQDFPKIYKTLLVDRNNNWLPKIEVFFESTEKEFVLVGAGHLVGDDGILKKLEERGYKVEQLDSE